MESMTVLEMQRFLNQQYAEGKTELEAYRNLMAILGLTYPQKSEKEKAKQQPGQLKRAADIQAAQFKKIIAEKQG